jgi:mycothiol synthase
VRVIAVVRKAVVGYGEIHHDPERFERTRYRMRLAVAPQWRRRGIARALWRRLHEELDLRGAATVRLRAPEASACGALAERLGFTQATRILEQTLHLDVPLDAEISAHTSRVRQQGITTTTLAAEAVRDPSALSRVHELENSLREESRLAGAPQTFEVWEQRSLHSPTAVADAYFLAVVGERYVGQSPLRRDPGRAGTCMSGLTGVLQAYRRRGIGLALKLEEVRYARERGYQEMRASVDARDEATLALNERVGFVRVATSLDWEKQLIRPAPHQRLADALRTAGAQNGNPRPATR